MSTVTKLRLTPPPAAQVAADHQPEIRLADISSAFHDEPRVHDLLLAERLGFKRSFDIRELIKRNADELRTYGALSNQQVSGTSTTGTIFPYDTEKSGVARRGRPTKEFWLNEGQALLICALARTTAAAKVRQQLITVFMAYRSGNLSAPVYVAPQVGELEAMHSTVEKMRAEVNTLSRKVSSLLGRLEDQSRALAIASERSVKTQSRGRIVASPVHPAATLLYGVKAIAYYLNLGDRQAQHLIDCGRVPSFKVGNRIVSTSDMLDKWLLSMIEAGRAGK